MIPKKRRDYIVQLLRKQVYVSIDELVKLLFVSPPTIRRDLKILTDLGLIERVHGGAMSITNSKNERPFYLREHENNTTKEYLASLALGYIQEGQSIFLDSSSTVLELAKKLTPFKKLKVLTNGSLTAYFLSMKTDGEIYSVGGRLVNKESSIVGSMAREYIQHFSADLHFFSCRGLSLIGGTDALEEEAFIKKKFLQQAQKNILLIDQSKIDKNFFYLSIPLEKIDVIITNQPLPINLQQKVDQLNIEVVY